MQHREKCPGFWGLQQQQAASDEEGVRQGAQSPDQIYLAAGRALSLWEESEDFQIALFRELVRDLQPIATASFIHAPRSARKSMLLMAMDAAVSPTGFGPLNTDLYAEIKSAIRRTEKLAELRNRIAHGRCIHFTYGEDNRTIMKGYFLLPPIFAPLDVGRHAKDAVCLEDLGNFTEEVAVCLRIFNRAYQALVDARQNFRSSLSADQNFLLLLARNAIQNPTQVSALLDFATLSPAGQQVLDPETPKNRAVAI